MNSRLLELRQFDKTLDKTALSPDESWDQIEEDLESQNGQNFLYNFMSHKRAVSKGIHFLQENNQILHSLHEQHESATTSDQEKKISNTFTQLVDSNNVFNAEIKKVLGLM